MPNETERNINKRPVATETRLLQRTPDQVAGSLAVPIHRTSSYDLGDASRARRLFSLEEPGNIYTRIMNPTTAEFEGKMATVEGGRGSLAVASGQAAETMAILNITRPGDNIVSADNLYGGTYQLFHNTMPKLSRTVRFADSGDPEAIKRAINDKTKAVYAETIGNPKLQVPDFEKIAEIAHNAGVPFIVDNTVGVGLIKPIDHGADIVVDSATKFVGGHGRYIGGIIVDAGKFDWGNGKFPEFTEPDPSYHGVKYWDMLGPDAFHLKARVQWLRDTGPALSPDSAAGFIDGLDTLILRQKRHSGNALEVARFLQEHPSVAWVNYPGLEDNPNHEIAKKYLNGNYGALVGFGIKGGQESGERFIDNAREKIDEIGLYHVANIGDARTLVIHPSSTTHQQLTPEEQQATGVTPDFIRLSVGLEDPQDIKEILDRALRKQD